MLLAPSIHTLEVAVTAANSANAMEGLAMGRCQTCGNEYDKTFEVRVDGTTYTFDCFECAIHELAPMCEHCGVRVIGHGVEVGLAMFCCGHCAHAAGHQAVVDRVDRARRQPSA